MVGFLFSGWPGFRVGGKVGRLEDVLCGRVQGQCRATRRVLMCSEGGGGEEGEEVVPDLSEDWRKFRAKLIAFEKSEKLEETSEAVLPSRWAHEVTSVELGCVLVASPSHFNDDQQYFAQTVIFITHHDEDGTCGVILNRPLTSRLSSVKFSAGSGGEGQALAEVFKESALYLGGPVGVDQLILLHDCEEITGSVKVVDGIYSGGLGNAMQRVRSGQLDPTRFRFFCGYAGWTKEQLNDEIKKGIWYVAASSNDVITNQCIQLPRPLWRQVLDLMGGKYADIARRLDELDGGKFRSK